MSELLSFLHDRLVRLANSLTESLNKTSYKLPEGSTVSVKSIVLDLLDVKTATGNQKAISEREFFTSIKNFTLALALLISSQTSTYDSLAWIPEHISLTAKSDFRDIAKEYSAVLAERKSLVVELLPEVVPFLKDRIKEGSIDKDDESDQITAASAKVPVVYAILAAYQFRWFVTQVHQPHLGRLCNLVIPCALTVLDHWSPEVKNVNAADIGVYEEVILDACCQNIASADEIWHLVVEMSVLVVTCTQRSNCRSSWFERMLNEMLNHLERQPRNRDRRIAWLKLIEPLFSAVGLVLLAHFRRIFPLFFQWMHTDDDETVLLVLKRLQAVVKLTWIRNTPYIDRLVDELANLYKEAALRKSREEIRMDILQILTLLQQCKGIQFEAAWNKYRDDPNLAKLGTSLSRTTVNV